LAICKKLTNSQGAMQQILTFLSPKILISMQILSRSFYHRIIPSMMAQVRYVQWVIAQTKRFLSRRAHIKGSKTIPNLKRPINELANLRITKIRTANPEKSCLSSQFGLTLNNGQHAEI
jgi:hypothetical protein